MKRLVVRRATPVDAPHVNALLSEWFDWSPKSGRLDTVQSTIANGEVLVAQTDSEIIGFVHYAMHLDVVDGGPNTFITALYVTPLWRNKGVGSGLLDEAISDSLSRGAIGVETSTTHLLARRLYESHHFKQTMGDIGEVFLELDVDEYLKAKPRSDQESFQL